jgi:outer membrane protein
MRKIALLLLIFNYAANAQEALTFDMCLERTMKNNLQLKAAAFDENIARSQHRGSYGLMLPNITADAEGRNSWGKELDPDTNTFTRDDLRNYEGTVNANFNLFSGLAVHNTIKRARQEKELVRTNIQLLQNTLTIDLAQRFITILYLQEIIAANEKQIEASGKQLELAQLKFDSGVISESELFKIKAQKASEELNLLTNNNRLADNMISLKQLMNMPLETEVVLLKPELELNENVVSSESEFELTKKAVDIHPAFQASILEMKKARTELAIARSLRWPTLSMRLMYRSNYDPTIREEVSFDEQIDMNTSRQIRFYLTIPIFNQFRNNLEIKTQKMLYRQSKVTTELERNRLSKEVLLAVKDAKTAIKKNEASAVAMEFSQKSYDADMLKFEVGKIGISELNLTKINFNTAQADLIQAKYELLFKNALIKFYAGEPFSL